MNGLRFKLILTSCILVFSLLTSVISIAQCGFTGLNPNYCTSDSPVTLSENESGGSFSGPGITGNTFDPAAAGPGTHSIDYTNTDYYTIDQTGTYSFVAGGGWTRFNSGGSNLEGTDDLVSAATPIGFTFNFFGNDYTNFYASSNGNIGFTSYSEAGGFSSTGITDTSVPNNFIALARTDLDPPNSNGAYRIQYKVTGVSPNRILIVSYQDIDRYDGVSGADPITTQVKLFETTNVIEIHSTTISSVIYDATLQGIENSTGTIGFVPTGRNNSNWGASNDFVSFTPCTDSQIVTVTEAAVVTAGGDTEICEGGSYNIKAPSLISGGVTEGTWSAITGGSDGTFDGGTTWSTSTTFTPGATDISNGLVTLRLTSDVPGGACGAVIDDIILTISKNPTVADAGDNISQCATSIFTMTANTPTEGTGVWSLQSGTATITNLNNPTTTVTGITAGNSAIVRWTISNGSCTDSFEDITLTNDVQPVADAGTGGDICGKDGANPFTFTGVASTGSGLWTKTSGPGTESFTLATSATTDVTVDTYGTYVFRWTETNGSCNDFDEVTVNFYEDPTVSAAGGDITQCNTAIFTMAANTPTVGTGAWTVQSGFAVTITNPSNPTTTVTGLTAGNTSTLRWTISNGSCSDSFDDVVITNDVQPVADAGTGGDICGKDGANPFTFTGVASTGSGLWTKTSGPGTESFTLATSATTDVTVDTYGTYVFRWTETNGSCNDFDEVTVTFDVPPVADADRNNLSPYSECDLNFILDAVPSIGGSTGSWTKLSGGGIANFGNANSPTTNVSVGIYDTYVFEWTEVNGACSDTDQVTVIFRQQPVADAGTGGDICGKDGANPFTFTGVASTGSGLWTKTSGPGTESFTLATSATTDVTVDTYGTYVFRWTETNGSCNDFDEVTVNFYEDPTVSAAGGDITQCNTTLFTMAANTPTVGTGAWTVQSGFAVTITNPSNPTTTVTGLTAGNTSTLRWTISNGSCSDSFDDVVITNDVQPVADAGTGGDICGKDGANPFTFTGVASTGSGLWTKTSGPGTESFTLATSATTDVTVDTYGTYVFRWTETNGSCNDFDEVTVNFYEDPTVSAAGGDITQCNTALFTMAANTPTVGTGAWTVQSGFAVTITNPSNPTTTVTGLTAGNTSTLRWTISNGSCSDSFDDVVITNDVQPVADAGTGGDICGKDGANPFTFTGVASTGSGLWTKTSGPGTESFTLATSATTDVTVDTYGTYVFRWTETNGSCNDFDEVTVNFYEDPTVSAAGGDITQCNTTLFTMAANTPTVGTGAWTVQSGFAVTITNPSNPTTTVTGLTAGNTSTLRWTISNGSCSDSFDDVVITNDVQPVADAGTGGDICGKDGANPFTFTGVASTGSGLWTKTSGPGTESFTLATSATTDVTVDTYGTYVFRWTETNGSCNDFDEVTVNFYEDPTVSAAGGDITQCNTAIFTMAANTPTVGTGAWTVQSGFAVTITNPSNPTTTVTGLTAGNTSTLRWTISNGSCSDSFDDVVITNDVQPVADAGTGGDICGKDGANPFTFTGVASTGSGLWTKTSGPGTESFTLATSATTDVTVDTYGTYVFRWTETNGSCNDFDEVTVNFYEDPTVSAAGGDITQCNTALFTMAANTPTVGTGAWTVQSGFAVTITNPSNPTTTVTGLTAGNTSTLRWTISNGSCSDSFDDVVITNDVQPVADAGTGGDICGKDGANPFTFTGVASTGSGLWTKTSGPGTESFTLATSATTDVTVDTYGTYVFRWTETNGSCNDFDEVTVNFYEDPTVSAAGGDITQCNTALFTMAANTPTVGTGAWTVQSGFAVTITNPSNPTTTVTGLTAGNTSTLRWTISNGSCSDSFDDVVITNDVQPVADAGTGGDICGKDGANPFTFTGVASTGSGLWTKTSGPGTESFTLATSATTDVTVDTYGTYVFRWTETNGSCNDFDEVTVNFYEDPTVSAAGGDITQCNTAIFTMAANTPTVGTGAWTVQSGFAVTITNPSNPTTTVTGLTAGNTSTLRWTISNGSCSDSFDDVVITNDVQPVADAGTGGDICGKDGANPFTFTGVASTGSGLWTKTSGPGTESFTLATSATTDVTVDTYGTYVFRWTETNGSCNDFDEVTVNFYEDPTVSAAGGDITQCNTTLFTMAANTPTVGTGAWTVQSGFAVTITNPSNPTTTVTGLTAGNTSTLRWTISNGSCSDSFDDVVITNDVQPVADAGTGGDICGKDGANPFTFTGVASTGSGLWTKTSGPGTESFTLATSATTDVTVDTYGTYVFRWTETNGSCNDFDEVTVNFYEDPTVSAAGGDITQCNTTLFTMAANTPTVGTGAWTVQSGFAVTITNPSNPTTTVTGLTAGNTSTLRWTISNGSCSDSFDDVVITNDVQPVADAGTGGDICGKDGANPFTFTGVASTGSGLWTKTSGPGTESFTLATSATTDVTVDTYGTYVFRWTETNGSCNDFDEVTVNFYEDPTVSAAGGDITQCNTAIFTMAANTPTVGTGAWTVQSGFAVTITNPSNPTTTVTGLTAGNTSTLRWTISNGSCSDSFDDVVITNDVQPVADAGTGGDICGKDGANPFTFTGVASTGSGLWTKTSGPGTESFTLATSATTDVTVDTYGTYVFRWTETNGSCNDFDEVTVNFYEDPTVSAAGGDITQCNTAIFTMAANTPTVGTGAWTVQSGFAVTITNPSNPTTTVTGLTAGNTSTLRWTISNGSCSDSFDDVVITNDVQPVADAGTGGDICGKDGANPFTFTGVASTGSGLWTKTSGPGTESFTLATSATTDVTVDTYGTYVFRWTETNGSCNDFDEVTVNFYEDPTVSAAGGDITQCNTAIFTMAANTPTVGTGAWTVQSGFAVTITNPSNPTTTVTGLTAGNTSTLRWTISNGSCSDSFDDVVITNDVQPVADAGTGGDICGKDGANPFTFTGVASTGSGLWTKTSGPGTESFTLATSATTDVTVDTYGTYVFRWTETNGSCNDFDEVTVNFYEDPTVSAAGGDITQCNTALFTMAANTPTVGTGAWTVQSGFAVTITNPSNPTTTVTGLTAGNTSTLRWTISNGSCSDSFDDVVITNDVQPVADAGTGGDICGKDGANPFTFTGVASTGSGLWTKTSGPGTESFTLATSATTDVTVDTYGTYVFRWTETNGSCNDFDEVTVNFYEDPTVSAAGGDITQCNTALFTMAANTPTVGTGAWTVQSGFAVTITNPSNPTTTVTGLTAGNTSTLRWTISNGSCSDSFDDVVITNDVQPVADAGTGGDICGKDGANPFTFTGVASTGSGLWTKTSGPGTESFTLATSATTDVTVDTYGTYVFRWTETNGSCNDFDEVTVNFYEDPTVSAAGGDITQCNTAIFTMAANTPTVGTGAWTVQSGFAVTITNPSNPTTTVTGLTAGNTSTLRWTISNGSCSDSFDDVVITNDVQPVADAGTGGDICGKDGANPFTFTGVASTGSGLWTKTSGPGTESFTLATSATTDVTVDTYGTYVFRWTETNGSCNDFDEVTVNFYEDPTVSAAGGDITQCNTTLFTMAANTPTVGTGAWTVQSGFAVTITNPSNPTTTVTGLTAGNTSTLRWTISNGSCSDSFDDVVITNDVQPVADAGTGGDICGKDGANPFTFTGVASTGSGLWTKTSGPGTESFTLATSATTDVTVDTYGTYVFRWTETNGSCNDFDEVTVNFYEDPTVSAAGGDITQCNTTLFTMAANTPTVGTGAWTVQSGFAVTITNPSNPTTTVTGLTAGNTSTLRWTISNGSCSDSFDDVVITNDVQPVADAGTGGDICGKDGANPFTFTGVASTGSGLWTKTSGPGTESFTLATSATTDVTVDTYGTYVFRWTETNGSCNDFDEVTVNFYEDPTVSAAGGDITQCNTAIFTMAANTPTVGTGAWTVQSGFAVTITNPSNPTTTVTGLTAGNTSTLRWTISNGSCSDSFDDVVITNDVQPVADAGTGGDICGKDGANPFTFTGVASTGSGLWTKTSGPGTESFTLATSATTDVTVDTYGTYVFRWTETNGSCNDFDEVTVNFYEDPTVSAAGGDITQCNTALFTMAANTPTVGTGAWTVQSGFAVTITNPSNPTTTVTGLTAGNTSTLRWTISNGSCSDSFDDVVITNDVQPVADAGTGGDICGKDGANPFTFTGVASTGSGLWTKTSGPGTESFTLATSATTDVTVDTYGTYVFRWTETNGSCNDFDEVTVNFYEDPTVSAAGGDITQCNTALFTMAANTPTVGTGAWTVQSGFAVTITNPSNPTTTVTGLTAGNTSTLRWTISNGSCSDSFDDVVITNDVQPVADAGTGGDICGKDGANPFTFTGVASTGSGLWTKTSGPGTESFTLATSATTDVTVDTYGTYVFRWTETNGSCNDFDEVTVNFYEDPTVSAAGGDITQCNTALFTMAANTPTVGTGAWTVQSGFAVTITNPSNPTTTVTGLTAGNTSTLRWTISNGSCSDSFDDVVITNDVQPVADAGTGGDICGKDGANPFTFTGVASTGSGLWTKTSGPGTESFTLATSATTDVTVDTYGTYVFRWTETNGSCNDFDEVTVNFYEDPTVSAANQSICSSSTTNVIITNPNNIPGTTFNWTIGTVTGVVAGQAAGSGNVITQSLTTDSNGGTVEYLIVATANGCPSSVLPVIVTVDPVPNGNSVPAGTNIVCSGTTLSITPTTDVPGTTFTWTGDNGSGGSGDITNTPINNTNTAIDVTYTVKPTGPGATACKGSDFTIVVTVNPNPVLAISNAATSICSGDATAITLNSTTANHVITVTNMTYGAVTGGSVSVTDTYTDGNTIIETLENPTDNPINVIYEFTITTSDGCPIAPTPQTAVVTVAPRPTMSITNIVTDMCSGQSTDITLNSSVTGAVMKLTSVSNTAGITGFTSAGVTFVDGEQITDALNNSTANPITITYNFTVSVGGCDDGVAPFTTNVTINPNPVLTISNAATSICSGDATAITLNSTTANHVITVTNMTYGAVTGGSVSVTDTYTDGNTIIETLENPTDNPINVIYEFTITTSDGCPIAPTPQTAVVTVAPRPTMSITNIVTDMCSGQSTDITLNSSVTGAVMKLTSVSNTAGITGFTSAGVTFVDGEQITDALNNSTANPITITYNFTVSVGGCDDGVAPFTTNVTINPNPVLTITNAATSICSGDATAITLNSTTANHVITVTNMTYGAVTGGSVSVTDTYTDGNTIIEILENPTDNPINVIYEFTITTSDGCPIAPTPQTAVVTVAPRPTMSITNIVTDMCSGQSTDITLNSSVTGAVMKLTSVSNTAGITGFTSAGVTFVDGEQITDALNNSTANPITITYNFTVSVGGCDDGVAPFTTNVTINPNPVLTITNAATSICSGDATAITLNSTTANHVITVTNMTYGAVTGGSVSVTDTYTDGNTIIETLENPTDNPINVIYEFTITTSDGCPIAPTPQTAVVTVAPRPTMSITNIVTDMCSGQSTDITLNSSVTGAVMKLTSVSNTAGITGFTSAGVTFVDGEQITDALNNSTANPITITYNFTVSVGGCDDGVAPFTTNVTINPNPVLTITNAATSICSGDATAITLNSTTANHVITVTNMTYGAVTGGSVSVTDTYTDGNTIIETLENPTDNPINVIYEFTITTSDGCPIAPTPQTAVVTVAPRPTMSITNIVTDMCSGQSTDITLNSSVTGAVMKLTSVSNTAGITGFTSAGVTFVDGEQITDALNNSTANPITITYNFTVSVGGCDDGVAPFTTNVTINPNPVLTITNAATSICSGDAVDITLNSPTLNHQINLVSVNYGAVTGGTTTGPYTDGNQITEVLNNNTTAAINVTYEFNVITSDGCPLSPTSQFTTVTVSPAPTFLITNNAPTICSEGLSDIDITSTTVGAVIELTNVVSSSVQIVGTPAIGSTYLNGANISNQLRNPTNAVQTVTYTFKVKLNNCVNPTSQSIVITINPIPTLQTSVAAQTICDGDMTNIVLTNPNNVANTNFSWTVTPTAGITGASAGSGGPSTATIAQTLINSGNAPGTVTYDIKPTANSCDGASRSIIVTVNPTPTLATTGNETICSGETTSIMLTNPNNVSSTSFSWVVLNNINSVSGAVNGSGTTINQSLFVNSNSPAGSVTYRITPSANNCDGAFQDVVVTVNPLPVAFAGFDYAICADGEVVLTASLTGSATSGTWTGGNNGSGFSNNPVINNEEITYSFDQTDSTAGFVTFTLTTNDPDGAGPCSSASDQITVIINSLPVVSFTDLPDSIAENDAPINLFGSPSGGIFSGDGISGNSFNPAGGNVLEDNFVTYTFTDANGCTNSQTQKIFINGKPLIVIGNQNVQICETADPDLLEADPTGGTWTGTGVVNTGGTTYEFRPADAGIGTHTLTYTFTDANNATNSADLIYEVYPTAIVDFGPVNLCFDAPIAFNDSSTVNQTPVASNVSSIVEWSWQFFDSGNNIIGASDTQNPTIIFNSPGDKRIVLTVVSKSGTFTCTSSATKTVTIGSVPDARFKWQSVCNGDFTAFNDDTILDIGSIANYHWDFDDGNMVDGNGGDDASENHGNGAVTQGIKKNPEHKYVNVGDYDVTLTVETNEGCVKSYTQNIDILPQTQITDFPYTVNFDQSDGDWAEEVELQRDTTKISKNSWLYSNVGSGDISPKYAGDGFWWTGNNSGSYYNSEHSWVNGPCFDFSVVERPMISMKIASSTDKGFDGAVLQSSIDGGVTWQNIGNLADVGGINWYNSNAISAKPGGQAFGFGWTGNENDIKIDESKGDVLNWIEVRHNLNGLKGLSNVLLRVAFGSNSDNSATQKNGFAFDDVYVGEKNRLVLIEHFTDSEFNSSRNMDNQLYDLGQTQLNDFGAVDFTTLQYHINQSGNDLFNQDNPGDPSARSIYYGVSQAPATVSDGSRYANDPTKLTTQIIDKRSLTDPLFNITIDTLSTTSDVLSVRAVFEANTVVNDIVTLQIAVVENNIVRGGFTYRNVLKKLLLGGEGQSVNTSWVAGQKQTITYNWNVDVEIFNPANLSIIAFVQNKTTHEIYGTALIKGQIQDESTVTSIGDDLLNQVRQISIYPNPASNELNFQLTEKALEKYSWTIVDQRGISIMNGAMEFSPLGVQTINTSELKNGVYYVIIEAKDKPLIYRKLAIMNRK